jgi:hypothetical protein
MYHDQTLQWHFEHDSSSLACCSAEVDNILHSAYTTFNFLIKVLIPHTRERAKVYAAMVRAPERLWDEGDQETKDFVSDERRERCKRTNGR